MIVAGCVSLLSTWPRGASGCVTSGDLLWHGPHTRRTFRPRSASAVEVSPFADFDGWGHRIRPGADGVVLRSGPAIVVTDTRAAGSPSMTPAPPLNSPSARADPHRCRTTRTAAGPDRGGGAPPDGEVGSGERLPPARELAASLAVSIHTVLAGHRQLRDERLIELRRGRAPAERAGVLGLLDAARRLDMSDCDLVALVRAVATPAPQTP